MSQQETSYVNLENLRMIEDLYARWKEDPTSVDQSWKSFFEGMQFASSLPNAFPARQESSDLRIFYLIHAYRKYGHLMANCDVLITDPPPLPDELKLVHFGLSDQDLTTPFPTGGLLEKPKAPLKEIIETLQNTYCRTIGIEYMELGSFEIEEWIQKKIEPHFKTELSNEDKIAILKQLNEAEGFETFLHTKYVGQKRFSLEGAETFIPLMHALLEKGGELGVSDVVLGMAHRGRLNVLANILGKSYVYIFEEFEDHYTPDLSESTGDVKYHMGFAGTYKTRGQKQIQIILSANPSHLESVDPVIEGGARALQEQKKDKSDQNKIVPVMIHGDAAVAGQGVVYETLTLSKLNGYGTKGTIHIVINNQIGFTTLPKDSRSTKYCTDIAKAFGSPVLHVNGEDPEACIGAARLAIELRQQFGCDVFIDLMGYRKYGHNESDEPTFTQPLQYQTIKQKKTMREIYRDRLIESGVLSKEEADQIEHEFKENLNTILETVKSKAANPSKLELKQKGDEYEARFPPVDTRLDKETLRDIGQKISSPPANFNLHPKVKRGLDDRRQMMEQDPSNPSIDWGLGELLAYGSLVEQGVHVRLSGQDSRRGTFSHRHSLYVDQVTSDHYFPLSHLSDKQAPFDVFNSPLSEFAVLGFEFGYSLLYPHSLTIWEAQFGDFANGAQVIIDQYFSTSEMKWGHSSNLTLLLPHGYEGMGPEHSSGRIERFLQLCGDNNMTITNCTTPAQFFHLLRRQGLHDTKKPLVVFTPKVLLRHPQCRSPLNALIEGGFEEILDDPTPPANPKRILLCSGKFYYDLIQLREEKKSEDVIIRIEQLYPLDTKKIKELFEKYRGISECIWVQEEHENMGAWSFLRPRLAKLLEGNTPLSYVGRKQGASTAAGSHALHKLEHNALVHQLYGEKV